MYEIPKHIHRNLNNPGRMIPYIIHQTFKTNIVPEGMYKSAMSYIDKNDKYDYFFYDDNDIVSILESYECSGLAFTRDDLLKAYGLMNSGAGKADLFRYAIIYRDGGCYFDIDTVCLNPLDTFIKDVDELVSGIGERGDLHQWGMIYSKKHAFIKKALENCVYNICNRVFVKGYKNSLEGLSGPPCLDMSIKQVLKLRPTLRFKPGTYMIGPYKFHILNGDYFGGNINFKYNGYLNDLKTVGVPYWGETGIFK